ncbi:MAG: integrase arm-type DNA-binding domain-containing protein [Bdellovibrionales bacterium]|nr:integrase arm-type DNA-binding domain-containing protein [Bdellovibrionales bacterium]
MGNLSALGIQKIAKPGLHGDGAGLYLQVSKAGTKSWIFRYAIAGKSRSMGLGPIIAVSLAEARQRAHDCRRLIYQKIDPIDERQRLAAAASTVAKRDVTFDECAARYIEAHRTGWKNEKHAAQWESTIRQYVSPTIGPRPVRSIDVEAVMNVLNPIWYIKTETASRVRNRIELVLAWARVNGYRSGDNPALWRGNLDQLLPKRSSVQRRKHFESLSIDECPAFISDLRKLSSCAALALEFLILTASRTNEVIGACWSEVDLEYRIWKIPANRMKANREHRVPLSGRAIEILTGLNQGGPSEYIFQGRLRTKPLSNGTFLATIKKQMRRDVTAHGFRSTFRDWAAERTQYQNEVIEMALAHSIRDSTEAAYRRGDLMMKRRLLMDAWAGYCAGESCELRPMGEPKKSSTESDSISEALAAKDGTKLGNSVADFSRISLSENDSFERRTL